MRQEEQRDLLAFLAPMALIAVAGLIVIQLVAQPTRFCCCSGSHPSSGFSAFSRSAPPAAP